MKPANNYMIEAVDRALQVFECIARSRRPIRITSIAHEVDLPASTVFRLLNTLARRGYVKKDPETALFELGLKTLEMGSRLLANLDLRRIAVPFLRKLNEQTGETVHLAVREGESAVYIDKFECPHPISIYARIGIRVPLYCTAVGKICLAFMDEIPRRDLLNSIKLRRLTRNTITERRKLEEELLNTRQRGYAEDDAEHEPRIACVGAPLWNHSHELVGSISVTFPTFRVGRRKRPRLATMVVETARQISRHLGFIEPTKKQSSRKKASRPYNGKGPRLGGVR